MVRPPITGRCARTVNGVIAPDPGVLFVAPGVGHGSAALSGALHEHAAHQERDEFPLLRRHVSAQRLHMMASALQDVRIMAAG
jgi:hypothetical protein